MIERLIGEIEEEGKLLERMWVDGDIRGVLEEWGGRLRV